MATHAPTTGAPLRASETIDTAATELIYVLSRIGTIAFAIDRAAEELIGKAPGERTGDILAHFTNAADMLRAEVSEGGKLQERLELGKMQLEREGR